MWFDILKIRKPGPEAKYGDKARNEFLRRNPQFGSDSAIMISNGKDFSFKGTYTYDELYNLIDPDVRSRLERLLKKGKNLLTQEYRLLMASTREKRDYMQSGKMPSPFTIDDLKDRITIKLKDDPRGDQEPTYNYTNEKIEIVLPITKRPVTDDSQKAFGNALDKLYKKFVNNNKQKKPLKWYQEYRRTGKGKTIESVWQTRYGFFNRPDFDADDEEIEYFKEQIFYHVFSDLSTEQLRSGADPRDSKFKR